MRWVHRKCFILGSSGGSTRLQHFALSWGTSRGRYAAGCAPAGPFSVSGCVSPTHAVSFHSSIPSIGPPVSSISSSMFSCGGPVDVTPHWTQWRHQTLSPSFLALIYAQNSKILNYVLGGEDTFPPSKSQAKLGGIKRNTLADLTPGEGLKRPTDGSPSPPSTCRRTRTVLLQQLLQHNSPGKRTASRSEQKAAAEEWSSIFIAPERSSRGINRTHPSLQGSRATVVTSHIYSDGKNRHSWIYIRMSSP